LDSETPGLVFGQLGLHDKNRFAFADAKFHFRRALYPQPVVPRGSRVSGGLYSLPLGWV